MKHRPRLLILLAVAIILEFLLFVIFNEEWKSIIPERNSSNDQETPRRESKIRRNNYSWAIHQFQEAGIPLNNSTSTLKQMQMPTNDDIEDLFSNDPLIFGEDEQCRDFLRRVPDPSKRWIGISGLFNSGTNLLFQLLDENCVIPGGDNGWINWQVPWGKHGRASSSRNRTAPGRANVNKDNGLVVVAVRDPYSWAKSMCKNPYIVKWHHTENVCPNLTSKVNTWGEHDNLMEFWNFWYKDYLNKFPYPWILVRVEDLTLRPKDTVTRMCNCAGGKVIDTFTYSVSSAKAKGGHKSSTGMLKAWKSVTKREGNGGFSDKDYRIAKETIDEELLALFGYKHPPSLFSKN